MATVKLTDVIDIEIYSAIEAENNPIQGLFFQSGIAVADPRLDAFAVEAAETANLPFWRDLELKAEPNYSDDSDNRSSPRKINQGRMLAKRGPLNQSWSARDLTNEATLGDKAMERIKARTNAYWQTHLQDRIIASTLGIYRANVLAANAGIEATFGTTGDMVIDKSIDNGVGADVNMFNSLYFNQARFTLGERFTELNAMVVHSVVAAKIHERNEIDYIQDSELQKSIPTYQGHRVVVSDDAPAWATTTGGGVRYLTTIFGRAAFGFGQGKPTTPFEMYRDPSIGQGGGEDTLYERKTWLIHPYGHTNLNVTNTGGAGNLWQTLADLRLATNWRRSFFRKNVPIAFLVTNG